MTLKRKLMELEVQAQVERATVAIELRANAHAIEVTGCQSNHERQLVALMRKAADLLEPQVYKDITKLVGP